MCDSDNNQGFVDTSFTRRSAVLTMTAAAAMAVLPGEAFAANVVETDVMVPTPDGKADAALFHPAGKGGWPAILMWPDILGLRPVFREMGKRLAAAGYVVLVPNPFYRTNRAPVVTGSFDFNNPQQRDSLMAIRGKLTDAMVDKDAAAFITFLDAQKQTNRRKGVGAQGYCFSGPFAFQAAADRPDSGRSPSVIGSSAMLVRVILAPWRNGISQ